MRANRVSAWPIEVTLQPGEKSFTEAEITEVSRKIVAAAEKRWREALVVTLFSFFSRIR